MIMCLVLISYCLPKAELKTKIKTTGQLVFPGQLTLFFFKVFPCLTTFQLEGRFPRPPLPDFLVKLGV